MLMSMLWGIFGATWFLFAIDELGVGPALVGIVAGVGGASSFIGAIVANAVDASLGDRAGGDRRDAAGARWATCSSRSRLPACRSIAVACLVAQQLIADSAITVYDVTETSVRQALVADRELGRVASTFQVLSAGAQLVATIGAGLLAEVIGLRATSFLAPSGRAPGRRDPVLVAGPQPDRAARDRPSIGGPDGRRRGTRSAGRCLTRARWGQLVQERGRSPRLGRTDGSADAARALQLLAWARPTAMR